MSTISKNKNSVKAMLISRVIFTCRFIFVEGKLKPRTSKIQIKLIFKDNDTHLQNIRHTDATLSLKVDKFVTDAFVNFHPFPRFCFSHEATPTRCTFPRCRVSTCSHVCTCALPIFEIDTVSIGSGSSVHRPISVALCPTLPIVRGERRKAPQRAEGKQLNIEWKGEARLSSRRWRRRSNDRCWQPDARTETDTPEASPPYVH